VELWHDLHFLCTLLHIYVVSEDGWSWALAWAQLGVVQVSCVPVSDLAVRQLVVLQKHHALSMVVRVADWSELQSSTDTEATKVLVCGHVGSTEAPGDGGGGALSLLQQLQRDVLLLVMVFPSLHLKTEVKDKLNGCLWQELRHRQLGGLTSARLFVAWWGPSTLEQNLVQPGRRRSPT
jgi:hypothetical protein